MFVAGDWQHCQIWSPSTTWSSQKKMRALYSQGAIHPLQSQVGSLQCCLLTWCPQQLHLLNKKSWQWQTWPLTSSPAPLQNARLIIFYTKPACWQLKIQAPLPKSEVKRHSLERIPSWVHSEGQHLVSKAWGAPCHRTKKSFIWCFRSN